MGKVSKKEVKTKSVSKDVKAVKEVKPAKVSKKEKKVVAPVESSDSSDSDDNTVTPVSKADSSSDSSSDEEDAKPVAKKADSSSDSDSSSDEEEAAKPVAKKADSSDSDSSSDEEDAKPAAKKESSSDSDSSSDEEDAKPAAKKADSSDSDSSSDDEDEKPAAKKESSDSSSSSDDEDIAEKPVESDKRKRVEEEAAPQKKAKVEDETDTTVFVGNLSWNVTEDMLAEVFAECGEVGSTRIITDRDSGRSKGFGYVEFISGASAKKAIEMTGTLLDGREIRVDISAPKPKREVSGGRVERPQGSPTNILFLGNLSFNVTEEEIRSTFGEYGAVLSCRFPTDRETGAFKGFGYLEFGTTDEAMAAVSALNGQDIAGRAIRLDYSQPRDNAPGGGRGGARGGPRGGRGGPRGGRGGPRGGRGGGAPRGRGGFAKPAGTKITFD
ncbi:hypothetical protein HDV02_003391 [Globomyces sp. JEL0801]|nr:hypothetical protein HDV02_003391 [Globomyces sp. JEL0801]